MILQEFQYDVRKDKWVVIGMILFYTLASFIVFPLACFHLFVMLVGRNSYWAITHIISTLRVLLPYVLILLFYIYAGKFFCATFENRMQPPNQPLNIHAKTILLYKNYFMVTPYGLNVTLKTKELESKAKRLT